MSIFRNTNLEFQGKKNLGDNVITTLDVDLQQTASDAIGKHRGAVIVMEPDTGKILTMVSQPNFNANLVDERWAELISPDNTKAQLVNRATQGLYPPGSTFKMLTVLENLPVICRTVDVFDKCAMIDEIIVVTQQELLEKVSRYLKAYDKMRMVVAGGETRTDSVMAGLAAVSDRTQLVAVHDGARPLVTDAVICRAVSKAKKFGAAAPAVRVKDTIKVSTDGAVEETPDRSKLYAVQTPQVFDRDLLAAALQNAKEQEIAITDDCSAVEALGMPVQLTDGDEENLKITTPLDLELAALILRRRANA